MPLILARKTSLTIKQLAEIARCEKCQDFLTTLKTRKNVNAEDMEFSNQTSLKEDVTPGFAGKLVVSGTSANLVMELVSWRRSQDSLTESYDDIG